MTNISIISGCNNNCSYCFQKDSYHNLNRMIDYDEFLKLLDWSVGSRRIAILGGEPTLHPQCVEICQASSEKYPTVIFTNLLCKGEMLEKLLNINGLSWLVNTTSREELKSLFYENMHIIEKHKSIKDFSFGITLTGDLKTDIEYIENLTDIGAKFPESVQRYRVAFASPCHEEKYRMKNYDKSIKAFYDITYKKTPYVDIGFDCSINSCYVGDKYLLRIAKDRRTADWRTVCAPIDFDVMADRSVKYCCACPDEMFNIPDYRIFNTRNECYHVLIEIMREFINKYGLFYCKQTKTCTNKTCQGACFAVLANLAKEEEKKSQFIQKCNEIRYKVMKKLGY